MNRARWLLALRCADCDHVCAPKNVASQVSKDADAFRDEVFVVYAPARCPKCRSLRAVTEAGE